LRNPMVHCAETAPGCLAAIVARAGDLEALARSAHGTCHPKNMAQRSVSGGLVPVTSMAHTQSRRLQASSWLATSPCVSSPGSWKLTPPPVDCKSQRTIRKISAIYVVDMEPFFRAELSRAPSKHFKQRWPRKSLTFIHTPT
jgi:hypothetical protein